MDSETRSIISTLTAKLRDLRAGATDNEKENEEFLKLVGEAETGLAVVSKAFQVAQTKGIAPKAHAEYQSAEGGAIQYGTNSSKK